MHRAIVERCNRSSSLAQDTKIEICLEHLGSQSCGSLLAGSPGFVLLCTRDVDSLSTALAWCSKHHIRVLPCLSGTASSEGACEVVHQTLSLLHEVLLINRLVSAHQEAAPRCHGRSVPCGCFDVLRYCLLVPV